MIDLMPPGLYEAVIEEVGEETANRELIEGNYLFRLVPRTLDDIRKLGGNSPEDDLKFAAVKPRVDDQPPALSKPTSAGRTSVTPPAFGEWARKMHPNRVRFAIFSDENPAMGHGGEAPSGSAKSASGRRGECFCAAEKTMAAAISATLSAFGAARDAMTEQLSI